MRPLLGNILTLVVFIVLVGEGYALRSFEELYGSCYSDSGCLPYSSCQKGKCVCRPPLVGDGMYCKVADSPKCSKSKECHKNAICAEGKCRCVGYNVGDGKTCRGTQKSLWCKTMNYCGDKGSCLIDPLFPNSPSCRCWIGFNLNDKNVCVEMNKPCKVDGDCNSQAKCLKGLCICQGNRWGDGSQCRAAKPCTGKPKCDPHTTTCLIDPMAPSEIFCKCRRNLVYAIGTSGKCVECRTDKHCQGAERCEDFKCKKPDLHLCATSADCHKDAECRRGKCHCKGLTAGDGKDCKASLFCPVTHECDANSVCIRDPKYPFSPYCRCNPHYEKSDDGKCVDIDECEDSDVCPAKHICVNTPGAFECHCKKGYQKGDNGECVKMACKCGPHGTGCNDDGECSCHDGYEKNGDGVCEDIDECALESPCTGDGEVCENQEGKYTCSCKAGYVMNSGGCVKEPRPASQVGSGHSVHVTSHLSTLGLVLALLGRLAFTA